MEEEKKRRKWSVLYGNIIAGLTLIAIGLSFLYGFRWEIFLIALGAVLIVGGIIKWYSGEEEEFEKP